MKFWLPIAVCFLVAASGCASHEARLQPIRGEFYANHLDQAELNLQTAMKRKRFWRERDVLKLDHAMIALAKGRPHDAERLLREVRDRFDVLQQQNLAEGAASFLTDDTVVAYPGEDYEQVLIRAMLAISNLLHDGEDAGAYALQTTEKQQEIIAAVDSNRDDMKVEVAAYKQVALGPYLRAVLDEDSPLTVANAVAYREQVVEWAPQFVAGQADLQRVSHREQIAPGHGVVYVFALVGRGPVKEEVSEVPTQLALLLADRLVSAFSKYDLPPTIAPVKVPHVVRTPSRVGGVEVLAGGASLGRTSTIVDVGEMAVRQHQARLPGIVARTVARRVIKKGVIYALQEGLDATPQASVALQVAGIAWEATEKADTRCWGLLPDCIQVCRVEVPAGTAVLSLRPVDGNGHPLGTGNDVRLQVRDGRHAFVLAHYPDRELLGQVLVNDAARE